MRAVITGATGQLGHALQATVPDSTNCIALDRHAFDLARPTSLTECLLSLKPDVLINTAAYTAVDKAESDQALAFKVNAESVEILAAYAKSAGIPFVQVSTDFVFDGKKSSPYLSNDPCAPLGVYGASKLAGEERARAANPESYIVRTGWVYSEHGQNFVKSMLRLGAERDTLNIVADQVGTPTYARHLAQMIWRLCEVLPEQRTFHFSDAGVASWYDFACAIFTEAKTAGLIIDTPIVAPIKSEQYPTPAQRPAYSVLDKSDTWAALDLKAVHWQEALADMLAALKLTNRS